MKLKAHQIEPGSSGQVLYTNSSGAVVWGTNGVSLTMNDLSDVTVTSPVTGQVIRWNGSAFVNAALAIGDITGLTASLQPGGHSHAGTDITTGVINPARLGAGTPSSSLILWGDGTWKPAPSGDKGVLLIENGATVPAGTAIGTIIFEKAL